MYAHVLTLLKYPSGKTEGKTTVSLFYIIFLSYILSTYFFSYCHLDFSDSCMFVIVSVPGHPVFFFFFFFFSLNLCEIYSVSSRYSHSSGSGFSRSVTYKIFLSLICSSNMHILTHSLHTIKFF